jgi:hypothetical protein
MENLNAVFINENIPQSERLLKLNKIARQQYKSNTGSWITVTYYIKINYLLLNVMFYFSNLVDSFNKTNRGNGNLYFY